ncbi:MAG: 2OG-Fe(II) oxygenase [Flavobacteriaceae bacterium]|nr:2OG-Fe(II) oxygenase [Flavobacteriaceae bacterium]
MSRAEISKTIITKLIAEKESLKKQFSDSKNKIGYFYLDNLLPIELADKIHAKFPNTENTMLKKSLKEYKHVAFQMDKYDKLLEKVIYAFQDDKVVKLISEICDIEGISPDKNLYAGGLSLMKKGNFLNPHLDNSHDKDRENWRVLNLLYYVTPNWKMENGGNLELWINGLNNEPIVIESKFNRLVVMATHNKSWHSVNEVLVDKVRCCVSNYYFSEKPLLPTDSFHVTSFRGRSNQKIRDTFLQVDNFVRMGIRKIFKKGIRKNPHQYKK